MADKKRRLFILLVSLIIVVGIIGFSLRERTNLTVIEDFVHDAVGWTQNIVNKPIAFLDNLGDNVKEIKHVYEENQVLREHIDQLRQLEYENQELRKEITELNAALEKTESDFLMNFQSIQASVIAKNKDQWSKQVTINKGTEHGVEPNMAVITGKGMIGKVQSSSPFTSTVLLLNGFDRTNRISVNVDLEDEETDASGFIVGYDEEKNQLIMELNERNDKIKEGQFVFSSGMGGLFPKGLEIGTITEVTPDKYQLTQLAYVEPSADLNEIHHVIVIDRLMTTMDEAEEGDEE